jgi:hypothetical protein
MIGYTLPEIRRLLAGLAWRYLPDPNTSSPGQTGGANANTRPGPAATGAAAVPSPNCRCSFRGFDPQPPSF